MLSKARTDTLRRQVMSETGRLPSVFGVLGDSNRFRIFLLLMERDDLCVTDIAAILGVSPPAASQHLRLMERAGLVTPERMGQMICYCLRRQDPLVRVVLRIIDQYAG